MLCLYSCEEEAFQGLHSKDRDMESLRNTVPAYPASNPPLAPALLATKGREDLRELLPGDGIKMHREEGEK